jgi:hypothetical protein
MDSRIQRSPTTAGSYVTSKPIFCNPLVGFGTSTLRHEMRGSSLEGYENHFVSKTPAVPRRLFKPLKVDWICPEVDREASIKKIRCRQSELSFLSS